MNVVVVSTSLPLRRRTNIEDDDGQRYEDAQSDFKKRLRLNDEECCSYNSQRCRELMLRNSAITCQWSAAKAVDAQFVAEKVKR